MRPGRNEPSWASPKSRSGWLYSGLSCCSGDALSPGRGLEWLAGVLQRATEAGERAILFCHFPVYPKNVHNLWDAPEVLAVIDRFPCVKAYVNGHNHAGNYGRRDGVHYLTMKGMVNTEETAFSVVELRNQTLSVKGFGREGDRCLSLSDEH